MVLISAFTKAVYDYNQMQTAQVTALARGDGFQFGVEMQSAGKAVGLAGAAILKHEREHGCDAALTTGAGV
jgi:hypothetical protein